MVRMLILYGKPRDPEAFDRHYREVHIPLAKKMPGVLSYIVSKGAPRMGGESTYHLVAEVDYPDMDTMRAAFRSEEGKAAAADVPNLGADMTTLTYEVAEA